MRSRERADRGVGGARISGLWWALSRGGALAGSRGTDPFTTEADLQTPISPALDPLARPGAGTPGIPGLASHYVRTGAALFRWRSYLPLGLYAAFLVVVYQSPTFTGGDGAAGFWTGFGGTSALLGIGVRALAVGCAPPGTSGRRTTVPGASSLSTTGAYSLVRHPLYLGNLLLWLGVASFVGRVTVIGLTLFAFWVYYERIMMAEEAHLSERFGETYSRWARRTPALFPRGFGTWTAPALAFDMREALGREYHGACGFLAAVTSLGIVREVSGSGRFEPSSPWVIALLLAFAAYLFLRLLRKHTPLLRRR